MPTKTTTGASARERSRRDSTIAKLVKERDELADALARDERHHLRLVEKKGRAERKLLVAMWVLVVVSLLIYSALDELRGRV